MPSTTTTPSTRQPTAKFAWKEFVVLLFVAATATTLAQLVRLKLIEPEAFAQQCVAGDASWLCQLRQWLVFGFLNNVFGIAAIIFGLLAVISRWRTLAVLALVMGITSAVLYRYEYGGVGILLGALTLARSSRQSN